MRTLEVGLWWMLLRRIGNSKSPQVFLCFLIHRIRPSTCDAQDSKLSDFPGCCCCFCLVGVAERVPQGVLWFLIVSDSQGSEPWDVHKFPLVSD